MQIKLLSEKEWYDFVNPFYHVESMMWEMPRKYPTLMTYSIRQIPSLNGLYKVNAIQIHGYSYESDFV